MEAQFEILHPVNRSIRQDRPGLDPDFFWILDGKDAHGPYTTSRETLHALKNLCTQSITEE